MVGIGIVVALVVLAIPVAVIVLMVGQSRLTARIDALERAVRTLREERPSAAASAKTTMVSYDIPPEALRGTAPPPRPVMAEVPPAPLPTADTTPPVNGPINQNRHLVMQRDRLADLMRWLQGNWVYAVSAISLAFAGIFFVQYGVERGLLPPGLRVLAAVSFGAALIGAGEWLRRRHGDEGTTSTKHLPSVFSGAGLVSIFAAVLAARQLYGLIGPEAAFVAHVATAVLAVVLGWFHGPLLVAVGLIGAALSPFIVAGGSAAEDWLYAYFALITAVGLAVDSVRRWAWVSVLALVLGYGGVALVHLGGAGLPGLVAALLVLAVLALTLPRRRVVPDHGGSAVTQGLFGAAMPDWPSFPVRLAAGSVMATSLGLLWVTAQGPQTALAGFGALTLLALALLFWAGRAEALQDLGLAPGAAFLAGVLVQAGSYPSLATAFSAARIVDRAKESAAPMTVSLLLGMAALVSAAFAFASFRPGRYARIQGFAAVLMAPLAAAVFELFWSPSPVLGPFSWALHIIALAAGMVALAGGYARRDGEDRHRIAMAALSALSLIALSLFVLTTKTALTLALAVLVVAAAALDRRYWLPEMGFFVQAATVVISYRLLVDPGLFWALEAGLGEVVLAFGAVIAACIVALRVLAPLPRDLAKGVLESAAAAFAAILANVLITRWLTPDGMAAQTDSHWGATLNAMPWLVLMLVQVYRARLGGPFRRLRQVLAAVAGALAGAGLALSATVLNPLIGRMGDTQARVIGPPVLDSLALAYGIPGLVLALAAWKLAGLEAWARKVFFGAGAALLALYAGLEIRRLWQGDWLGVPGVLQPELYSYTVAMMLVGAALLYQAIARPSDLLRRIGMAVIAATVVKVFFLDAAGLTGLTRVASFAGLGLALAGLAWLNRWAGQRAAERDATTAG